MIPVSVITGFLGSGKTTLLARLLRDPAMNRTAVIINEFGEVGLDHDLVETSDESFVQLSNGCLCCNVRSDLILTLSDLAARRAAGTLPPFDRVVVETTGLADPAPILHALMTERSVNEAYALDSVITTVDAVTGLLTFDTYEESLRQAAVADKLVITKTDLPAAQTEAIRERLSAMNPTAELLEAQQGAIPAEALFGVHGSTSQRYAHHERVYATTAQQERVYATTAHHERSTLFTVSPSTSSGQAARAAKSKGRHTAGITSFCIVRDEPVRAVTLALFLSGLAENCGADLLRMKGIVNVLEEPDRPAVIHGVQHVYHAPEWLDAWPSDDRRTRMVFIGRGISERWVRGLLELLEAEVADETARRAEVV